MQNDIYNERKQISLIKAKNVEPLQFTNNLLLNDYSGLKKIQNINEFDNETVSTHKNSADSYNLNTEKELPLSARINTLNLQKDLSDIYFEGQKKRKDYFGREIKKGGKHKIVFADDLDIIKSLELKIKSENNCQKINKLRRSLSTKNNDFSLPSIITTKRSNSPNNNRLYLMKNIYNISKIKTKSRKKFKKSIVEVIKIENLKKQTKLNTFSMKNRIAIPEEENVSCSCYCSIW